MLGQAKQTKNVEDSAPRSVFEWLGNLTCINMFHGSALHLAYPDRTEWFSWKENSETV